MNNLYPEWFKVEKETKIIITHMATVRELSFYLKSNEQFIRRLAIIRLGELKFKEATPYLSEIIENLDESPLNRELAAWAIKAISITSGEDIITFNRLLTHFTGRETPEEIVGQVNINLPICSFSPEFDLSSNSLINSVKDYTGFNTDFVIDNSFSLFLWGKELISVYIQTISNLFRKTGSTFNEFTENFISFLTNSPKTILLFAKNIIRKSLYKHTTKKKKSSFSANSSFIYKPSRLEQIRNYLSILLIPLKFCFSHKFTILFFLAAAFLILLNNPGISQSIEHSTKIDTSQINTSVHNILNHIVSRIVDGATDLFGGM